jgi:hypothetical protein
MKNWMSAITLVFAFTIFGCTDPDIGDIQDNAISASSVSSALNHGHDHGQICQNGKSKQTVEKAIRRLGINMNMKTDPQLIEEILRDDMKIDDLPSANALFSESLRRPVSLKPMLKQIRKAIEKKHPAVVEFLCEALEADLIPKIKKRSEESKIITRVLHHTYLLNELTLKMASSTQFHMEMQQHLLAKRTEFGIRADLVGALEDLKEIYGGPMFGPTKVVSMDLVNGLLIQVRAAGGIPPQAVEKLAGSVKLNILEAGVTENMAGYNGNAMTAAVLAAIPPSYVTLDEQTRNTQWGYSDQWNSLYETWNLAFITGNATYLQIYYPKLLIPAVIDADSETYIANRAMSLWASLSFRQFAALSGKPDMRVPNKEELTEIWSDINYKYATALAEAETGHPIEAFAPALNITLEQIMEIMKQSIFSVPLTDEERARLEALYETP